MSGPACWVGVASADHVAKGVAGGFCQLGHGKHAPVKRLKAGDRIVYYSPREGLGEGAEVRAFTAVGDILPREPYRVAMSADFEAWRRDVAWRESKPAPIAALIPQLAFIKDKARWGYPFRRGAFTISAGDFAVIAAAMGAGAPAA